MSPSRVPGLTVRMPRHMASKHTSLRRWAAHGGLARVVHTAGIAMETVFYDRDINIDDVSGLELPVVRDPVAHHVVDRGADGFGKTSIIEVGRDGSLDIDDVLVAKPIQLVSGDAWDHMGADHIEHFGGKAARLAHLQLLVRGLYGDVHYFMV